MTVFSFKMSISITYRVMFTIQETIIMFLRTALPYENINLFRRYFEKSTKVSVFKNDESIFLFQLYFFFFIYFAFLNVIFYFFPQKPFVYILFSDTVHLFFKNQQFYLFYSGLIAYTIFLYWSLYFNCNLTIISLFEDAFDNDDKYARKVSIHFLGSQTANTMFRQIAFLVINLLQVFILIVDICLIIYTFELWMNILTCDLFFNSFFGWIAILVSLFHLFLNFALWYSFAHALIFLGVYGITTLVYVYLRFMINFAELRRTLTHFSSCHRDLTCILRENIRLFEIVFIGDRYFGKLFLLYLLLHLPISAYFLMEIFLGKVVGIARFAFIGLIIEAFVGSIGLHVATAHFSGYIHRGGKMLLNFNAKHNHGSKLMPLRRRLLIWRHINRLWVDKKFGISYAGICDQYNVYDFLNCVYFAGLALVTMKTFSRFIFIYSELLMVSYSLIQNSRL